MTSPYRAAGFRDVDVADQAGGGGKLPSASTIFQNIRMSIVVIDPADRAPGYPPIGATPQSRREQDEGGTGTQRVDFHRDIRHPRARVSALTCWDMAPYPGSHRPPLVD